MVTLQSNGQRTRVTKKLENIYKKNSNISKACLALLATFVIVAIVCRLRVKCCGIAATVAATAHKIVVGVVKEEDMFGKCHNEREHMYQIDKKKPNIGAKNIQN